MATELEESFDVFDAEEASEEQRRERLSQQIADGFLAAANWIRERKCGYQVCVVAWSHANACPLITFPRVADLKALLPGVSCEVEKTCTSTEYTAMADGIEFRASKHGCVESPTKWTETL